MAYSNSEVADRFAHGKKAKGLNMFSTGDVVYSYGQHFPIAFRFAPNRYLFNNDNYSRSTMRHQRHVASALSPPMNQIWPCHTEDIKQAIMNPVGDPIIIKMKEKPNSLCEALTFLKEACKEAGMKRFPFKRMYRQLQSKMLIEAI